MIEEMFPTLPRIELFARGRCEGWDCWGNEIPYNAVDDFAKSIDVAYEAVRERVVYGGPPWAPKASPTRPLRRLRERSAAVRGQRSRGLFGRMGTLPTEVLRDRQ